MRKRYDGFVNPGFRYLADIEVENPLLVVAEFFDATTIELFRQELKMLFTLSFSQRKATDSPDHPERLIGTHQRITRLLEMAWLCLNKEHIDLTIDRNHPLFQDQGVWRGKLIDVDSRLSDPRMQFCRVLQDKEINNIKLIFEKIFTYMSLSHWQDELDMVLYYSLCSTAMAEECENSNLCFPMHGLLEKLVEGMQVIHELKIKTDRAWNILPPGTRIMNQDNDAFPPELIVSLYDHENKYGELLTEYELKEMQSA